jgi:YD repeat-containing protein
MGSGSTPIYQMMSANMLSTILTTTVTRNGQPVSFITNNGNNSFYSPSAGVFVPQYTQVQIAGNPIETRELYNGYDVYGHLLERQKVNGVNEDYLWGYDSQFPVAKIVGAPSNSAAASLVSSSILNAPSSDAALRQELSKLRTGLPAALVTIYTYDNVYGLTSVTDPTGRTSYYNYDPLGRLSYIQDQDLNVIKRYSYNYAGMPDGSTSVINTLMSALVSTTVPWVVTFTNTATSASSTFNAYPGSSATVFGNLPMGYYNISITPMYTLSGSAQLIFNGVTYTGTSFSLSYVDINGPNTFTLQPAPSSGPCSFTMSSGYSSPTNSISSNGTTASGYLVFYSGSTMSQGNSYFIATINGGCRPSATRSFSVSAGGRSWTVTIYSSGQMYVQMAYGSASLSPNSTVSISLSYTL